MPVSIFFIVVQISSIEHVEVRPAPHTGAIKPLSEKMVQWDDVIKRVPVKR